MAVVEKLGQFYLGRVYDLASGTTLEEEVHYDARDLTTHAVCVGMTGSGKTGLCLSLLEEAAIDGIPAICIDPKGDIGNLMLTFPGLTPEEFAPWIDPAEAARKQLSVDELAKQTAELWRKGLAEWEQGPERIQRLRDSAEVAIYTPASDAGRPLTVLRSFTAPRGDARDDRETFRDRILAAVSGLLALLQIDADPVSSREHILLSGILEQAWNNGQDVQIGDLIRSIQDPPFDKVGFLDLESFYPSKDRFKLAMALNNLVASPGFAGWLEGDSLDIQKLLYTDAGKPRLAIISIAHLSDQERMFFVTILLNEVISWMRNQTGTSSLRALLYMDEVFGYFPPTANPPSKQPMLTLLKQARAFGLGCVLATQNPVDLDYKGLSNAGTWFLGRLQTERDKLRVLEGLEGAAATSGAKFDRQQMEQILAGLGNRVFLMNNVHEDHPVLFRTRWALSYLRGPISRLQIQQLMDPLKEQDRLPSTATTVASSRTIAGIGDVQNQRPVLPPGITEFFVAPGRASDGIRYRPALMGQGRIHFVSSRRNVDVWDDITLVRPVSEEVSSSFWGEAEEWDESDMPEMDDQPVAEAEFAPLDSRFSQKTTFDRLEDELKDWLYRHRRLTVRTCPALDQTSTPDESEADFRIRLRHQAREERDAQVEKLRAKYASRLRTLEDRIRRAEQKVEREKSQRSQKAMSTGISVLTSIAGALFSRRLGSATNFSRAGTAMRSATSMAREAEDVKHAQESLHALYERQDAMNAELQDEVQRIQDAFDPELMELSDDVIEPRKSDINVGKVILVWLPFSTDLRGRLTAAF